MHLFYACHGARGSDAGAERDAAVGGNIFGKNNDFLYNPSLAMKDLRWLAKGP